jgi:hypothetical protein
VSFDAHNQQREYRHRTIGETSMHTSTYARNGDFAAVNAPGFNLTPLAVRDPLSVE